MGSKRRLLILWVTFFLALVFHFTNSYSQQGSVYISAGYNMSWFGASTIHIEQADLGNSYNMVRVKGDSKTGTAISPTSLDYRIGYFYNDWQTNGVELSYDPVNYQVTPNRNITIKGIVNNMFDVDRTVAFNNGSYYQMTGANFIMLSLVKRVKIYMANTKNIDVSAIGKIGAGPAMPHFASSLPINPVDDPGLNFAGWNAGGELGVRVRGYRYIYLDLTAKYDYASFNSLKVYDGTARQNLTTYSVMASIGFTFPTTHLNPLFFRERKIVTILPFYQNKDQVSKTIPKRKVKYDVEGNEDTTGEKSLDSIPEFDEIVDRKYRKEHPDTVKATWYVDSLGRPLGNDSISAGLPTVTDNGSDSNQHLTKRQLRKKRKEEARRKKAQQNLEQKAPDQMQDSTKSPAVPGAEPPPPAPDAKAPDQQSPEQKAPDAKEPGKTEPEAKPEDKKQPEVKSDEKKEPEAKPEEKTEPEMSKKERKRKAKEERRAQKEKEKEEKAKEKEKADNPAPPPPENPDTTGKK